jgi:aminoglycoside 6'-N-acetyltransferase I
MIVRPVQPSDADEWLRMRMALFTESMPEQEGQEIARFLAGTLSPTLYAAFVSPRPEGGLCGLIEVSIRPYADGCESGDVGYLEAWYVDADSRNRGIGRSLVLAAEQWARSQGCREMASDADITNIDSQTAHKRLGYTEVGRVVQFCKPLDSTSEELITSAESTRKSDGDTGN